MQLVWTRGEVLDRYRNEINVRCCRTSKNQDGDASSEHVGHFPFDLFIRCFLYGGHEMMSRRLRIMSDFDDGHTVIVTCDPQDATVPDCAVIVDRSQTIQDLRLIHGHVNPRIEVFILVPFILDRMRPDARTQTPPVVTFNKPLDVIHEYTPLLGHHPAYRDSSIRPVCCQALK